MLTDDRKMEKSGRRMEQIAAWTPEPAGSPLLLGGLPLPQGLLEPRDHLALLSSPGDALCPFWQDARSFWPDGSTRWLFVHAILPPGCRQMRLMRMPDEQPEVMPETSAGGLTADRIQFAALPGGFEMLVDGRTCLRLVQAIDSSLPASGSPFSAGRIEDSPISPLYRVENTRGDSLCSSYLVRIDPAGGSLTLACRYSVLSPSPCRISRIGVSIGAIPFQDPASQAFRDGDVPAAVSPEPDDIYLETDRCCAAVADGARRGPVRLCRSDRGGDAYDLVIGEADEPLLLGSGVSIRQNLRISLGGDRRPARIILPAGYVTSTGVFGPLPDLTAGEARQVAPGLAAGLEKLLDEGLGQAGRTLPRPGILNDGDWLLEPGQYGARGYRAYADNEYDTPYAYFLAHAAYGNPAYKALAVRCGIHMADIDCRCTTGDMLYHGYNETAEDHQEHREEHGDLGHTWTDGLWTAYFWTGDPYARETALALTRRVIRHFSGTSFADEFAICERNVGWPLLVAVSALETGLADEGTALFAGKAMAYLDGYMKDPDAACLDPKGPVWWRCALQDGSKPFMLGVLGEAVARYARLTGEAAGKAVLDRIAAFIMKLYDPVRVDFEYEYNAYGPNHRHIPAQHLIPLFGGCLMDSLCGKTLSGPCKDAVAALQVSAWCLYDRSTGKDIAMITRGLLPAIARLLEIQSAVRAARDALPAPSDGADLHGWISRSAGGTGCVKHLENGVYADRGDITVDFSPGGLPADGIKRQSFFHICGEIPNQSAVSAIAFYDRIQVRFYDRDGRLIDSLDAFPEPSFYAKGARRYLRIAYEAPGHAGLSIDGQIVSRTVLSRPLSGSFHMFFTGCKPGNWTVCGDVTVRADFARPDGTAQNGGAAPRPGDAAAGQAAKREGEGGE